MFSNEKVGKSSTIFFRCEKCDYNTCKKFNYDKHILTAKHLNSMFSNENVAKVGGKENEPYICNICNKIYKDNSGLWRHKKNCYNEVKNNEVKNKEVKNNVNKNSITNDSNAQELIQYLMKENSEFKQLLIDQSKQMGEISKKAIENAGHNHINSHNKTFNLQVFLNETCKNAINISEFIDQLQVSISDLEDTGRLGFTEGISKIFINGLKQLDIPDRPLHCSDLKRETIYIKDNNEWTKDSDENPLLINAIKHVSNKNMKKISEWKKEHPEHSDSSSKVNDKYLKIICESMPGSTKEESDKNYKKIVKKIVKESVIDKSIIT
jgi:hypothetical protein